MHWQVLPIAMRQILPGKFRWEDRRLSRRDRMIVARQFIAWNLFQKGIRPVGYGMIGSDTRATIGTINQPGVRVRPCPTGRILDWTRSRQ